MSIDLSPINEFWREWSFFHPNHTVGMEWEEHEYPTLRNALEATKTPIVSLRKEVRDKHPLDAAEWGKDHPCNSEWKNHWHSKINDWTLLLVAQKLGLTQSNCDYDLKLKYGYWASLTAGRTLTFLNSHCDTFWGRCRCAKHEVSGKPTGSNHLGIAIQAARAQIIRGFDGYNPQGKGCDWCRTYRKGRVTEAVKYILYYSSDHLVRRAFCPKHEVAEVGVARKKADHQWHLYDIADYPPGFSSNQTSLALPPATRPPYVSHAGRGSFTNHSAWTDNNRRTYITSKDTWGAYVICGDEEINHTIGTEKS